MEDTVNLYDVLRLVIRKLGIPETLADDCLKVVDEAERFNVLGSTARQMDVTAHECDYPRGSNVCTKCMRGRHE